MKMRIYFVCIGALLAIGTLMGVLANAAPPKGEDGEKERVVKESEVPAAALGALKKLAGGAKIAKFEEEIEHGSKFYEGEWMVDGGKKEARVTEHGDLVEIEESVSEAASPKSVVAAARKMAGDGAAIQIEKKTLIVYEVKFEIQGKRHEICLTPDGRAQHDEAENDDEDGADED
ncbi:MAG: hypothetical protein IPK83_02815 [Planctomycetes bacterium]|nr:hypothetical protein [Planctomycetota bacterium]